MDGVDLGSKRKGEKISILGGDIEIISVYHSVIQDVDAVRLNFIKSKVVLVEETPCIDSDGGKNYYVKGTLVNGNNTAVDYCSGANANGLIEFYCNGSSFIQDFLPSCTSLGNYMCQNGACILNQTNSSQII